MTTSSSASVVDRIKAWPHETHVFGGIGLVFLVIGTLYASTGGEAAGIVLLFGSTILSFTYAVYLLRHARPVQASIEAQEEGEIPNQLYLPEQSLWPVGIGTGGVLVLAGFAVGSWVLVAGVILLLRSVVGFVVEGRRR
ncbi:MAG: cytochrome c oxidase subunit 4 [Acidimicrobiales bacterium]|nr:cytochrome c oxidase subunit 4 [Acidimicrobiales bacterium]